MRRLFTGLGALLVLLAGVVGAPYALLRLGGNLLPRNLDLTTLRRALFTPDDGTILIGLITIVGWAAWVVFAVSVLAELVSLLSGHRLQLRLPGLGGPQRLAAGLLIAVIAMLTLPQMGSAPSVSPPGVSAPAQIVSTAPSSVTQAKASQATKVQPVARSATNEGAKAPSPPPMAAGQGKTTGEVRHTVKSGDDLWSLAESYYGQGREWRKIATANPEVLTGGPDRLTVGMKLLVPDVKGASDAAPGATVTVRRGDTLSGLAESQLGSSDRWPELYQANRTHVHDPDELAVGMSLIVPVDPDTKTTADPGNRGERSRQDGVKQSESKAAMAKSSASKKATESGKAANPKTPQAADPAAKADKPSEPGADGDSAPDARTHESTKANRNTKADGNAEPDRNGTATEAPAPGVPQPARPGSARVRSPSDNDDTGLRSLVDTAIPLTGVGALLAAGLLTGLSWRRRLQMQARPVGRRIPQPPPVTRPVEVELGRRQRPLSVRSLDQALRAISAHCRSAGVAPPPLRLALVSDEQIELIMKSPASNAPPGFVVDGSTWLLPASAASGVLATPGFSEASRPWTSLVTLGRDDRDRLVLADLECLGLLTLPTGVEAAGEEILAAMAVELSFSPWADEMILTLVGSCAGLPPVLGKHNVSRSENLDGVLTRLEKRAAVQRDHHPFPVLGQHRIDPDLADPWVPEIVMINAPMTDQQSERLTAVVVGDPRVTIAAVVIGGSSSDWAVCAASEGSPTSPAPMTLAPVGLTLTPQRLTASAYEVVLDLVATTGSPETTPAPWWAELEVPPDPPPDNVTYLGNRSGEWGTTATIDREVIMETAREVHQYPTLQLLGPIELLGAQGALPPRAGKQCLEYCAWLLEHPGTTAQAMSQALIVAEGTRRSNMSRLRSWLGANEQEEPYLPDAYTGRITLHPTVSSDWQRLQILTTSGVNRASDSSLRAALELVRGAPLADAAPGQWHWAEMLRTDMVSCVRDIGVELTERALDEGDVTTARWAASRALAAAPGDELLIAARVRTEHVAGNVAETERLSLQLAAQARNLGVDLDPSTVSLLQQVMEGRVRARLA